MMKKSPGHIILVLLAFTVIFSISCREVYYPDDIEKTEPVLSIDAVLHEDSLPVVKLLWTAGYYESYAKPVHQAVVRIDDDSGNSVILTETEQTGIYTATDAAFTGRVGSVYTLEVETEDGSIYASNPVMMPPKPSVDSFYVEPVFRTVYWYSSHGRLRTYEKVGLSVCTRIEEEASPEHYYRFRTRAVRQVVYTKWPGTMMATTGYYWTVFYTNEIFDTKQSELLNNQQVVDKHESGFLEEPESFTIDVEDTDAPYFRGWILTHRVYAVTEDVFRFYESVRDQLDADNEIFAPVPAPLESNVYCVNDPAKRVIGVFEASSFRTFYKACYINGTFYTSFDIPWIPENIVKGTQLNFPPDFWVNIP